MTKRTDRQLVVDLREKYLKRWGELQEKRVEATHWKLKCEQAQREIIDNRRRHKAKWVKLHQKYLHNKSTWESTKRRQIREQVNIKVSEALSKASAKRLNSEAESIKGLLAYPFIYKFAKKNGFKWDEFSVFVIAGLLGEVTRDTFVRFGFNKQRTSSILVFLVEQDLLQDMEAGVYVTSLKGITFFKSFKDYFKNSIKAIQAEDKHGKIKGR